MQQQAAGVDKPFAPGVTVADLATAVMAVSAILAALYDRERTGDGQWIDVTLMECQLAMLGAVADQALNGSESEEWRPFRHPVHAAGDGYVNINIGGPRDWSRVAAALGHGADQMPDTIEEANAHRADERLPLDDLYKATEVVALTLFDLLSRA